MCSRGRRAPAGSLLLGVLLIAGLAAPAIGQEFRGTITGLVTDSTGGVLPGVTVTVTNVETNVSSTVVTGTRGEYDVRFLLPGKYAVSAELDGFKKLVRSGIQVMVGDALVVNLTLEPGGVSETVQVVAEAPRLNLANGSTGQVITSKQVNELPLGDGTAYMLAQLAPGVANTTDLKFSRPMDNANLGAFNSNGVKGGNNFTLDGSSNIVSDGRVGFSPPSDAIQEFRVETNSFDAQAGHTAGAVVNLALKSGTNQFRGTGSYFNRDDSRSANDYFTLRQGKGVNKRKYDRWSGTLGGPVFRDRTFFMGSYEGLWDLSAEPTILTVPSDLERRGNFSGLLPIGTLIYDPWTAKKSGSSVVRTAFPGNIMPDNRLDLIAMKVLSYYPTANRQGLADGTNNFYSPQQRTYNYNAELARVDHNISENQRLFATWYRNFRVEDRYNWAGTVNGFDITKGYDNRSNFGLTAGYTSILRHDRVLDVRFNASKFGEWRDPAQEFDPATLGFPADTVSLMRGYQYFPRFAIQNFATIGSQRSDYSMGSSRPFYTVSFLPTMTMLSGRHAVKAGYEFLWNREKRIDDGYQAGYYTFNGDYTRASSSGSNLTGQGLASFMLGLPTSGYTDVNVYRSHSAMMHVFFVQDDWKVSPKLTLNGGFRLEYELGLMEANDRNLRGFDLTSSNPIEAAARAAYTLAPIAELPADRFRVPGGVLFVDSAHPKAWANTIAPLPRAGGAYQLTPKTVIRGGWGLYTTPFVMDAINQLGYSWQTQMVVTQDQGLTLLSNLAHPFPGGLQTPPGSSLGLATANGRDLVTSSTSLIQYDREKARFSRFQIGIQRELPGKLVVEAYYVATRGSRLPVRTDINAVPQQYYTTSRTRDNTVESFMSGSVTNPFYNLLPGTSYNGKTIARNQLLRPYPEFGRVAIESYDGNSRYHAGEFRVEKRFSSGFSVLGTYTYSRLRERVSRLNPFDTRMEDRLSPDDRPHRLTAAGIVELPFGKGRRWGGEWNRWATGILGGWQVQGTYQYQSGNPLAWGNLYYDANMDPAKLTIGKVGGRNAQGQIIGIDVPAWDTSGFYFHDSTVQTDGVDDIKKQIGDKRIQLSDFNTRYFPSTIDGVRNQNLHLLDFGVSKSFPLGARARLQARVEAINALNYLVLWSPDLNPRNASFGRFSTQRNLPRDVQVGVKVTF